MGPTPRRPEGQGPRIQGVKFPNAPGSEIWGVPGSQFPTLQLAGTWELENSEFPQRPDMPVRRTRELGEFGFP